MKNGNGDRVTMSLKQMTFLVGILSTLMGGGMWLHGEFVVPSVVATAVDQARREFRDQLREHSRSVAPHPGVVRREEMEWLRAALDGVNSRLDRIEEKVSGR